MQAPLQLAKASGKQPPTNPIHSFIQNLVAVAPILLTPPPLPPQQLNNKQNVANSKAPAKNLSNKTATTSQSESPSLLVPRPLTTVAEVALHMADNPTFRGIHLGTGLTLSAADIIGIPTSVMITSFVCLGWCTIVEVSALVTDVTHLLIEGFRRKVMNELEIRDAAAQQRLLTGSDHNSAGGSAGNKGGKGTITNKVVPAVAPPPPPKAPTATKTSGPSYLRKVAPTHVEPPPAEIVPLDTVPPIIRRVSILVMLGQTSSSGR